MNILKLRSYNQFSLSVKIIGYIIGFLFCIYTFPLAPPFTPIVLWAMFQAEINRRKNKVMVKLNNWAVYNEDQAKLFGIEPNYVMAFDAKGITGMYLNITSSD